MLDLVGQEVNERLHLGQAAQATGALVTNVLTSKAFQKVSDKHSETELNEVVEDSGDKEPLLKKSPADREQELKPLPYEEIDIVR